MKFTKKVAAAGVGGMALLGVGLQGGSAMADHYRQPDRIQAQLKAVDGSPVGDASVTTSRGKTWIEVRASNLTPGWHAIHLHSVGKCEGDFTSAAGHVNNHNSGHPDHEGDLPQLLVQADGTALLETPTDRIKGRDLLDGDGSAIVIHKGADNYANIPDRYRAGGADDETKKAGDSGGRVACGVLSRG